MADDLSPRMQDWFAKWDDVRPQSQCRHCKGTGMADEFNECGFCYADEVNTWVCGGCGGGLRDATHTDDCAYWIGG